MKSVEGYLCTGLDRPVVLLEVEEPSVVRQSAHEGDKVVSPTHSPRLHLSLQVLIAVRA